MRYRNCICLDKSVRDYDYLSVFISGEQNGGPATISDNVPPPDLGCIVVITSPVPLTTSARFPLHRFAVLLAFRKMQPILFRRWSGKPSITLSIMSHHGGEYNLASPPNKTLVCEVSKPSLLTSSQYHHNHQCVTFMAEAMLHQPRRPLQHFLPALWDVPTLHRVTMSLLRLRYFEPWRWRTFRIFLDPIPSRDSGIPAQPYLCFDAPVMMPNAERLRSRNGQDVP